MEDHLLRLAESRKKSTGGLETLSDLTESVRITYKRGNYVAARTWIQSHPYRLTVKRARRYQDGHASLKYFKSKSLTFG